MDEVAVVVAAAAVVLEECKVGRASSAATTWLGTDGSITHLRALGLFERRWLPSVHADVAKGRAHREMIVIKPTRPTGGSCCHSVKAS